jgi:hypothetical protein
MKQAKEKQGNQQVQQSEIKAGGVLVWEGNYITT